MNPAPIRPTADSDVFKAIADPTRRALLDQLRAGPLRVGHLAAAFDSSRPAISKHLSVLSAAGLVTAHRAGREHVYALHPAALGEVAQWLDPYRRFWQHSLGQLKQHLEQKKP